MQWPRFLDHSGRGVAGAVAGAALLCSIAWAGTIQVPSVGINERETPELQETIPISMRGEPRTIVNLEAAELGPVKGGDTVEAFSEVEVSVTCLEPMPKCVGKRYRYSPKVEGQLVLANGTDRKGTPIGNPERVTCAQDLPNRNHHCVLYLHRTDRLPASLPCAPTCSINLVLRAYHSNAKRGNVLVIGADQDSGIAQKRATLSAAVLSPGVDYEWTEVKTTDRIKTRVDVDADDTHEVTVASIRLDRLTKGESLAIEAKATTSIGHLPYNVLSQGHIVISEKPGSSDNHGIPLSVVTRNGNVAAKNGFNCTQGKSAFATPCDIEKGAWVRIINDARKSPNQNEGKRVPLWVNFFVGFGEEYATGRSWRPGDQAKIRSVSLKVRRFTPATP